MLGVRFDLQRALKELMVVLKGRKLVSFNKSIVLYYCIFRKHGHCTFIFKLGKDWLCKKSTIRKTKWSKQNPFIGYK